MLLVYYRVTRYTSHELAEVNEDLYFGNAEALIN